MSYSILDIESDPETTIIAPRFNDEASRSAAPVVPLTNHTTDTFNPIGQNRRQSWSIAAIFLATLIGGAAGGFALDLYLRRQKAQQVYQAASPTMNSEVNASAGEETKPLIVAAPPTESIEAEIPAAAENTTAVDKDDAMDEIGDEEDGDQPEPVKQVVPAPPSATRNNTQSEKNQETPPTQHRPVLKQQPSSTIEENQTKEGQINDNAPKIENRQENESQPAPTPEADAGQINRVREIFEGRPRRVTAPAHTQRGSIDRVREIFEGHSSN
jgi:hypothetical protein